HGLQQGQIATLDNASFHRTEQPAGAVGALEQHVHHLVANRGCQRQPATQERCSKPQGREPIERREGGQLHGLRLLGVQQGQQRFLALSAASEGKQSDGFQARRCRRLGVGGGGRSAIQQRFQIHSSFLK